MQIEIFFFGSGRHAEILRQEFGYDENVQELRKLEMSVIFKYQDVNEDGLLTQEEFDTQADIPGEEIEEIYKDLEEDKVLREKNETPVHGDL